MRNFIINLLKNEAADADLMLWWNEFDSETANGSSQIMGSLEEWGETFAEEPADFARRVYFGNVQSWNDNYFWLNGNANFESSHSLTSDRSPISFDELAEWLIEEKPSYIQDWIAEWEEMNAEGAED